MVSSNDWPNSLKELDDTKAGVKGLLDAGITQLPKIFHHPHKTLHTHPLAKDAPPELPTIDLSLLQSGGDGRRQLVEEIRKAAEDWGFFGIVNHGIPWETMEAMVLAVKRFHELPKEEKAAFYTTDPRRRVKFNSNLPTRENDAACWRDLLSCVYQDDHLPAHQIPSACRDEVQQYVKYMIQLREVLSELLSEGLGLRRDYLSSMECMKSEAVACMYYPKCPEPEKTLGSSKHSDTTFLTLLMQDSIGGLQILRNGQWVDVPAVPGTLIANIGDLMQIISNDKFISVEHRVVAQAVGPRISVATFFMPSSKAAAKPFAPIKELLSEENPAKYREVMFEEYYQFYKTKFQEATSALPHFKIP